MTTPLEGFLVDIKSSTTRLTDATKRATRIGVIGIVGLSTSCSVEVLDDFNTRLYVADAVVSDNPDGSVVNPTDTIGLDADLPEVSQMDVGQPPIDIISDAQAPEAAIDSQVVQDSPADTNNVEDVQIVDAGIPTDVVIATDIADANDVAPTDTGTTDTFLGEETDSGFDANEVSDTSLSDAGEDLGPTDAYDSSGDISFSDSSDTDIPRDTATMVDTADTAVDIPSETGVDASMGTRFVTGPTSSGLASCNRIIVVGIAGCMPGSTTCEYNRNTGGQLRYYVDVVTTPAGYPLPYDYGFSSFLGTPISRSFATPDTGNFTPTFTSGTHIVQVNLVSGPALVTRCYGPTITIVTR